MRLVDADAPKESVRKKFKALPDRCEINGLVNDMPTIDAIPVEWIKALTNHSDMFTRGAAKWVMGCWKKEQEAR